jgi:hypothetical protein
MSGDRFLKPIINASVAAVVLICHIALAAIVIFGIKGIELLVHSGSGELLLFDQFPLRYLFHAIDIGIILVFGWHGLKEAALAFRG